MNAQEQANIASTRQSLMQALEGSCLDLGHDPTIFRKALGRSLASKLDAHMARNQMTLDGVVADLAGDPARLDALAQILAPCPTRQGLAARGFIERLQSELSTFFFRTPPQPLPRQGRRAFVVCPDLSRSADAFGRVDDVGYVFVHKCSNLSGGAQNMVQSELDRIALAATFPEGRYEGFVLRSPERVLARCAKWFECRKIVLVLLQDGGGRDEDMADLRRICAQERLHASLFVFADTTDNFLLMQPMIHAHVVGRGNLTPCQEEAYAKAREAFMHKFPAGHNGFAA